MHKIKGCRTNYGKVLLKNGFEERKQFVEDALHGIQARPDFLITPQDILS
ncbi:MAG: hypothetical protein ACREHC_05805 [Candidatus Levyibacteriota bacterium]